MKCRFLSMVALFIVLCGSAAFAVTIRDVAYDTKNAGRVQFSHSSHLTRKEMVNNCRACHDVLFNLKKKRHYLMADMEKGKSCGACHNGTKAFALSECARCHQTRDVVYKVKATGPTRFSHKAHTEFSGCGTCHPKLYAANRKNRRVGMAEMQKGKSCGACHNGKQAFAVKECLKCHPARELLFEEKSAGNVPFSHTFHTALYGCGDCHTKLYGTTRSKVKVTMQKMEEGASCGSCHDGKTTFSVKEKCDSCHKMS